ncbi:MAG TPA: glycerol-3-phosphate 1-O-acyltransferase PlsY [Gemmataceae bacterium]|jgi:glycerol-3-phosphate acyltransferase PlsY|nr:glycerol-3-phosphate 1-O-acyltransferase PlsY [Gemmataceae bacterium]
MLFVLVVVASYLVGAIPFGYLVARARGVDILHQGSGNIGATNVGRVLGKRFGIVVFFLDFLKGAVPAAAALWLAAPVDTGPAREWWGVAAGLAAFGGHIFPVYLNFRGGKGVATGAGVVAVLLPGPACVAVLVWLAFLCAFRYVSLASIAAVLALCAMHLLTSAAPFAGAERILTLFCFLAALLVILRHRTNLVRLLRGSENQVKGSTAMTQLGKIIHVLALGLWFGGAAFFTLVAAPAIFFDGYGALAKSAEGRPAWFPSTFDTDMANQLAGFAVAPIFPRFFLLQGICGLLAIVPALAWARAEPALRVHRVRFILLALALVAVLCGWPLAQKVTHLRALRYAADSALAAAAKADFATWHGYSLTLSLVTLALVTVAMALAAYMPGCSVVKPAAADSSANVPS